MSDTSVSAGLFVDGRTLSGCSLLLRRRVVIRCDPSKAGDTDYFNGLAASMADPSVKAAFYSYLESKASNLKGWDKLQRPITEAYKQAAILSMSPVIHHLAYKVSDWGSGTISIGPSQLRDDFAAWAALHRPNHVLASPDAFYAEFKAKVLDSLVGEDNVCPVVLDVLGSMEFKVDVGSLKKCLDKMGAVVTIRYESVAKRARVE